MSNLCARFGIIILLVAAGCASARAATEAWTYSGLTGIFQIVADGAGGCAITHTATRFMENGEVVWLDKKGALLYQAGISNVLHTGILICTPKNLVYSDMRATNLAIHVALDGTATLLPAAADTFNRAPSQYPIYQQFLADAKGFFAVRTDTNTMAATLVRYTNK
jgi:hypothetical protein